jgi:hypothetical protein
MASWEIGKLVHWQMGRWVALFPIYQSTSLPIYQSTNSTSYQPQGQMIVPSGITAFLGMTTMPSRMT